MARKGRQITAASLEAKIEKQKELLAKSKAKYEADNLSFNKVCTINPIN